MSGTRAGSRAHSRARGHGSEDSYEPASGSTRPLVAVAQILLGVTLSCLIAALGFIVLIGIVAGVLYLTK